MTPQNGNYSELAPPEKWPEILRWIHRDSSETAEFRLQHSLQTLNDPRSHGVVGAVRSQEHLTAAVYAALLPGRVASLGGLRVENELAVKEAVKMVDKLIDHFVADEVELFQALSDGFDKAEREVLTEAGFHFLAYLDHLVLSLDGSSARTAEEVVRNLNLPEGLELSPYRDGDEELLESLISDSYIDTLDCPLLGGGRSGRAALDGYLDSRDQPHSWWIARLDHAAVGCLLLWEKISAVWELTYMGVIPDARGNKLGEILLEAAIGISAQLGAKQLILSVDRSNAPAIRIYEHRRFDCYNSTEVWFRHGSQRIG